MEIILTACLFNVILVQGQVNFSISIVGAELMGWVKYSNKEGAEPEKLMKGWSGP